MDQETELKPGHGGLGWLIAASLPLLYLLSIGPVAALAKHKPTSTHNMIQIVYFPVIWLHDHTPLKKPLEAYVELWGVR
ncbi:MAG TPA: hypothetical protein VN794_12550 [Methylomirabilota bacterium]|jgi:hypothetical protein|nr:hypothetical protein [Methylomirabilota bacterium]